jgi:hypothetical protein
LWSISHICQERKSLNVPFVGSLDASADASMVFLKGALNPQQPSLILLPFPSATVAQLFLALAPCLYGIL